jgi:hypothetical protein
MMSNAVILHAPQQQAPRQTLNASCVFQSRRFTSQY